MSAAIRVLFPSGMAIASLAGGISQESLPAKKESPMQLSDLRNRDRSNPRPGAMRGDESLVLDSRGGLSPVDCIERKLGILLPDESIASDGRFSRFANATGDRKPRRFAG